MMGNGDERVARLRDGDGNEYVIDLPEDGGPFELPEGYELIELPEGYKPVPEGVALISPTPDFWPRVYSYFAEERARLQALGDLRGRPGLRAIERYESLTRSAESTEDHMGALMLLKACRAEIAEAEIDRRDHQVHEHVTTAGRTGGGKTHPDVVKRRNAVQGYARHYDSLRGEELLDAIMSTFGETLKAYYKPARRNIKADLKALKLWDVKTTVRQSDE